MGERPPDFTTVSNSSWLKVPYIPKRYIMVLLAHIGVLWFYALRVNLSVAIVAMVTALSSNKTQNEECPGRSNDTFTKDNEGEFLWSSELQGVILGSFSYGYMLTQIIGGRLAEQFGGKRVFGIGLLVISLLSLLSAVGVRLSVYLFIAMRVAEGLAGGVILPAVLVMFEKWAPASEGSKLNSFIVAGVNMGIVVSQFLAGVLVESGFLGGWPSVFYVMGTAGLLSSAAWFIFVTDTPAQHATISSDEREYIEKTVKPVPKGMRTPWRSLATSLPVWAFYVMHSCAAWGFYTMMSFLPTYMDQILHFKIRDNGFLSSLPYFITWMFTILGGFISDVLIEKVKVPTVVVRKLVVCSGVLFLGAFPVVAGYTGCHVVADIVCLTLGIGLAGLFYAGMFINPHDIAPNYAATLFGISNTLSTTSGFIAPYVAGCIIGDQPTQARWRIVFLISGAICAFGAIFYGCFASGEIQPWSVQKAECDKPHNELSGTSKQEAVQETWEHGTAECTSINQTNFDTKL